jgi:hypothetical protein
MKANSPTTRILAALLFGLVLGISFASAGVDWLDGAVAAADPVGTLWLNALRMTIVPLVFALLVTGIASSASAASAGGLALRALLTFAVLLFLSGLFGEIASKGFLALWPIPAEAASALQAAISGGTEVPAGAPLAQWLVALVPANPIKSAAEGEMLPLGLFAIVFGFATIRIAAARGRALVEFFQAVVDAMLVIVHWVILVAPIGVFALAFVVGARAGLGAAHALGHYLALLVSVQVLLILLVYPGRLAVGAPADGEIRTRGGARAGGGDQHAVFARLAAGDAGVGADVANPPRVSAMVLPMAVSVFRITSPTAKHRRGDVFGGAVRRRAQPGAIPGRSGARGGDELRLGRPAGTDHLLRLDRADQRRDGRPGRGTAAAARGGDHPRYLPHHRQCHRRCRHHRGARAFARRRGHARRGCRSGNRAVSARAFALGFALFAAATQATTRTRGKQGDSRGAASPSPSMTCPGRRSATKPRPPWRLTTRS